MSHFIALQMVHKRRPEEEVSFNMSRIRGRDTKIEKLLGSAMYAMGLRYRKQYHITGRPDFAFPSVRVAIFCDSDFWHGRNWETARDSIRSNRDFWIPKIEKNIERDKLVNSTLASQGWTVIRFWEDQITSAPMDCATMVRSIVERKRIELKLCTSDSHRQ